MRARARRSLFTFVFSGRPRGSPERAHSTSSSTVSGGGGGGGFRDATRRVRVSYGGRARARYPDG